MSNGAILPPLADTYPFEENPKCYVSMSIAIYADTDPVTEQYIHSKFFNDIGHVNITGGAYSLIRTLYRNTSANSIIVVYCKTIDAKTLILSMQHWLNIFAMTDRVTGRSAPKIATDATDTCFRLLTHKSKISTVVLILFSDEQLNTNGVHQLMGAAIKIQKKKLLKG